MADIILHHYDLSPFSEKIRLALGYKGLPWKSVKVEAVPPRPLMDVLTGGYRRVPVLQIGADVYCDTEVIFRAIERTGTGPTLYPTGEGLSKALSFWWDRATWKPAIGVLVDHIGEHLPEGPPGLLGGLQVDHLVEGLLADQVLAHQEIAQALRTRGPSADDLAPVEADLGLLAAAGQRQSPSPPAQVHELHHVGQRNVFELSVEAHRTPISRLSSPW